MHAIAQPSPCKIWTSPDRLTARRALCIPRSGCLYVPTIRVRLCVWLVCAYSGRCACVSRLQVSAVLHEPGDHGQVARLRADGTGATTESRNPRVDLHPLSSDEQSARS
eukprot:1273350-Pleurochrysis_carterae.AAC.1